MVKLWLEMTVFSLEMFRSPKCFDCRSKFSVFRSNFKIFGCKFSVFTSKSEIWESRYSISVSKRQISDPKSPFLKKFGSNFWFFIQNRNLFSHFWPLKCRLFTLVINAGYDTLVFYNRTLSRANISFGCTEVQYKYCLFFLLLLKKVTRFWFFSWKRNLEREIEDLMATSLSNGASRTIK